MAASSLSVFSKEQQAQILDSIVGGAGFSRLYMSILVSRTGSPPFQRSDEALDRACSTALNWVIQHYAAVAIFDLMLQEKVLIDVNADGDVSFLPGDIQGDETGEGFEARLTSLITAEIVAQSPAHKRMIDPIDPAVIREVRTRIASLDAIER